MHKFKAKLMHWLGRINVRLMRWLTVKKLHIPTDRPVISFTFDDVPESARIHGAAILEQHGLAGTFYIAGGLVGTVEPTRRLITREGVKALAQCGHEIGRHTYSHHNMSITSKAVIAADIAHNEAYLQELLSEFKSDADSTTKADQAHLPRNFAYPYNAVSFIARKILAQKYRSCRAGENRINRGAVNPMMLYGMEIGQPEATALMLTNQIDALLRQPGWLIFFTHDISDQPTPYGCTPQTFSHLVDYAVTKGCDILPVNAALDRFAAVAK